MSNVTFLADFSVPVPVCVRIKLKFFHSIFSFVPFPSILIFDRIKRLFRLSDGQIFYFLSRIQTLDILTKFTTLFRDRSGAVQRRAGVCARKQPTVHVRVGRPARCSPPVQAAGPREGRRGPRAVSAQRQLVGARNVRARVSVAGAQQELDAVDQEGGGREEQRHPRSGGRYVSWRFYF